MRNARPKRLIAISIIRKQERIFLGKGIGIYQLPSWTDRKQTIAKRVSVIENRRREPRILKQQSI